MATGDHLQQSGQMHQAVLCGLHPEEEYLIRDTVKNQLTSNPEKMDFDAQRLIGSTGNDPSMQQDIKFLPFKVFEEKHKHKPYIQVDIGVMATNRDTHPGGEDFDQRVMEHFIRLYKKKTGKDVRKENRAVQNLRHEVEKAKWALSAQH
ncbi:Hypothetical predicted protein [Marmota monax]|uniref:Uncharacterized protein n=1 Tax=Marmota monax TaxID=9995 RepID=A0A5E4BX05_MARMO|nr:hypothetical protein GHT09_018124 [Marmota monax]VTJ74025.1 Hypothetical predicted protein [Marmota monax]